MLALVQQHREYNQWEGLSLTPPLVCASVSFLTFHPYILQHFGNVFYYIFTLQLHNMSMELVHVRL